MPLQRSLDGCNSNVEFSPRAASPLRYDGDRESLSSTRLAHLMHSNIKNIDQIPGRTERTGAEHAAQLLASHEALLGLSLEDARTVIQYMQPRFYSAKTTFIREGDTGDGGFMALLVEGEVIVERITSDRNQPGTVKVLGPGSLIGEMALVDREPRSASCTADSDVWCAILTRDSVHTMMERDAGVAARLLLGMSAKIAERLRGTQRGPVTPAGR